MAFNFRGPKVMAEFINLFEYFKIDYFIPFSKKNFIEIILSMQKLDLHNGVDKKTFVSKYTLLNCLKKKPKGLKIITPQREIIFFYRSKILKLIENSLLVKFRIVDKQKIKRDLIKYELDFKRLKKNKDSFKKLNSYNIWKFLSSELFVRGLH